MSAYRRGTVLGLTVAEIFILLAFLLLFALLLRQMIEDEAVARVNEVARPSPWKKPEKIVTLEQARRELSNAEKALNKVENERIAALNSQNELERELDDAKQAMSEALHDAEDFNERNSLAEAVRDLADRNLTLFRKGENPPCWYEEVPDGKGGMREKPYYAFDIAIYDESVELALRRIPPGGALDDTDQLYVTEWREIGIDDLPYGKRLSDAEFIEAISGMVSLASNRQIRSYACRLWVMVWDKTPDAAKERWQNAHDKLIEGYFGAYTVQDLEWHAHPFSAAEFQLSK